MTYTNHYTALPTDQNYRITHEGTVLYRTSLKAALKAGFHMAQYGLDGSTTIAKRIEVLDDEWQWEPIARWTRVYPSQRPRRVNP